MAVSGLGDQGRRAVLALLPAELRRIMRPPYEVLVCVIGNGVLATGLWFFSPVQVYSLVFTFHVDFLFPAVLATWMLADVPATNQLAPEATRVIGLLDNEEGITHLLRAKQAALMLLVVPVAVITAILTGMVTHHWFTLAATTVWVTTVPLAGLGLSCFVGVRWPYHPLPLAERWAERRQWRPMLLRWGVLVTLPYVLVPTVGFVALVVPGLVLWLTHGLGSATIITDGNLLLGEVVAVPTAVWLWRWGTARAGHLAFERRAVLAAYLADPELG